MSFDLAPGISFCRIGDAAVFLDVHADRYFTIGDRSRPAFDRLAGGDTPSAADIAILEGLAARRVLAPKPGSRPQPCDALPPVRAALDEAVPDRARPLSVVQAAFLLSHAKRALRRRPLDAILADLRSAKRRDTGRLADEGDVRALAWSFHSARRIVGSLDQCLAVSIAMMRRATALGIAVDLVFGVKLRPFHAHAWVQSDRIVLSDDFDTVRPFTPILVV